MMISLSGCYSNNDSFDDPDIVAYINGEPIYDSNKEHYIFMAKQFTQAIVDAGKELHDASNNKDDDPDILYQRMVKMTAYSDVEWVNEYFKTFLDDIIINELVKDKDDFSEILDMTVSQEIQKAIDKVSVFRLYNGSIIDYGNIIEKVANHFDLSYEECVENIYRPFITSFSLNDLLFSCFVENKYDGQKIKWDETNTNEYVAFLLDAYTKYDEYIDTLLNKSEIVFGPR